MTDRLFGTNGVRGVINKDMDVQLAMDLGKAIGTFMGGRVAIGNDSRTSAAMIKSAVAAGLMCAGVEVLDLGLVPTPVVQHYVKANRLSGGVMITASHNPPEFNGIKCVDSDGTEMPRHKEEEIERLYFTRTFRSQDWKAVGRMHQATGAVPAYLSSVKRFTDLDAVRGAGLTAVLDCANGAGVASAPQLLDELNVRAITLNGNPLGTFPGHPSEPVEAHLKDLIAMVKETGADMGIAHDGDADRTIFIDDRGRYMYGDKSLAITAAAMVRENGGGIVVTPVSSSACVEDMVRAEGGEVLYTRVGAPVVARKMIEVGAVFGGEENGGLIFPKHQYCRDGAMTVAKMLEIVSKQGPLSELVDAIPQYCQDKRKLECPDDRKERVLAALVEYYCKDSVDTTDGVKICYSGGWTLVRPSGTEPLFRVYSEARTLDEAKRRSDECEKVLSDLIEE
ncbi:phosphoglucosamine mutase [Methanomassiliicoccus luminyensis]|uniref:phosphoglucosamine mutase n=1 Tax=Methanomassiliicoccus luminyensis TaxID=1080712 RepID=UPI000360BBF5|nr:phosphoglucosamine mutase [Methanomassiliicoccus luminyensis]